MDTRKRSAWVEHWGSWEKKADLTSSECVPLSTCLLCRRECTWMHMNASYPLPIPKGHPYTHSSVLFLVSVLILFFLILWPSGQIIKHYLWVSIDLYFWPSFSLEKVDIQIYCRSSTNCGEFLAPVFFGHPPAYIYKVLIYNGESCVKHAWVFFSTTSWLQGIPHEVICVGWEKAM